MLLQHLEKGFFVEPTIITDINTSMQIWKEEVFGPVLCVKTFATEEEAIELANDTKWVGFSFLLVIVMYYSEWIAEVYMVTTFCRYGLGAAVLSKDLDRCDRVAKVKTSWHLISLSSTKKINLLWWLTHPFFFRLNFEQAFQAGIVWINCSQPTFTQAPWGGKKHSGFGRDLGEW